jgi:hypothetical protein
MSFGGIPLRDHVKILAVLHIAWSGLMLGAALIVMVVFGGLAGVVAHLPEVADSAEAVVAAPFLGMIGFLIMAGLLVFSLPGLIVGFGLYKFQGWGRIAGIVLSVLNLLSLPFGTALGIYGLWVLLHPETEPLFRPGAPVTVARA